MKITKKFFLITVSAILLVVCIISINLMFGVSYAWFSGKIMRTDGNGEIISITGYMGEVSVYMNENNDAVVNESTVPIILRVRIIAEWKQETSTGSGTYVIPILSETSDSFPDIEFVIAESKWILDGNFLVYKNGSLLKDTNGNDTIYAVLNSHGDIFLPDLITCKKYTDKSGKKWTLNLQFIPEAIQATPEAYNYASIYDADRGWN